MGISSSKSKAKTSPIYEGQITGAANTVTGAYNTAAPKIAGITDQLGGLVPGLIDRYTQGDPGVTAATNYNSDVLGGRYLGANPYLDEMVSNSNNEVRNNVTASLGTRGLTGGSAMTDIISRNIARNTTDLYGQNYEAERNRMGQAAGLASNLAAAREMPLQSLFGILDAQQAPVRAASGMAGTIGGLLGAYTNQTKTSSPSITDLVSSLARSVPGFGR